MIRVICPHCDKKMAVDDSKAGKLVRCPGCREPFRIAEASEAEELEPQERAPAPDAEAIAPGPPPRRRVPDPVPEAEEAEAAEADEPEKKRGQPRRRKKRRKSAARSDSLLTYILLGLAGVLYVGLLLLSLFAKGGAILLLIIGGFLFFVGHLWFMYIARQEDELAYWMIRYVPFYAFYFAVTRFHELAKPFLTGAVGVLFLATSGIVMLAHKDRPDPNRDDTGPPVENMKPADRERLARRLLGRPDKAEARAWLKARPGRGVLSLETAEAVRHVEALYAKGAKEVLVAEIDASDPNEENAEHVVVVLPEDDRQALFVYARDSLGSDETDVGQKYLVLP